MAKKVLVTAGRMPAALEICRALARTGATVVTADCYAAQICQGSHAVSRSYTVASPRFAYDRYKQDILDIVRREKIDLIVPVSEDVLYLARFADELSQECELFFSPAELLYHLHHKQKFVDLSESWDLSVPRSQLYTDASNLPDYCANDYILKQVYSRAGQGVIFASAGEHPRTYGVDSDGTWVVQKRLLGETLCSCTIIHHGKIRAHLVYRPSVIAGSVGVVFKQIDQTAIRNWVENFARKSKYHGIVSFDFIVSPLGEVSAIECNPRPTSGVHLFEPEMLGYAIQDPDRPLPKLSKRQRAQVSLGMLTALPSVFRKVGRRQETFIDILRARDVMFSWRDPFPALYQLFCYSYIFYIARQKKVPLLDCMLDGVEWNGDEATAP
ncbi:MAG: hypothetical protein V4655_14050 [Bdellovibrionota bacterium]|nr:MAG: hypothetical protein EOP10_18305 [Pseudomonadota bacterium]